jgi:TonB-linked SusC/RagA family outer membrane protein
MHDLKQIIKMPVKLWLCFVVMLFSFTISYSQSIMVKGKVIDASNNQPLPGVNIVVDGTTIGVITDIDGIYQINADAKATLIFSFIGYQTQRVAIEGKSEINISLSPELKELDEVVVIGYGTAKKRDLTGPISSVSGQKINEIPISSAAQALTGRLAGVQVVTTEGSPDAEIKIRVRGGGSITRDNSPLYIVDGFPVDRISDIPPTDIQSVDVLKDASSTAIYGARGANGVVIITTKSPKEGKLTINYNGYAGIKYVPNMLDVMSPYEFVKWQYEQAVLQSAVETQYDAYFGSYEDMDLYKYMGGDDWQNIVFGNIGRANNHSITMNGGSDKLSFNASYNKIYDKAVMLGSNYSRDNLNLKVNTKISKILQSNFSVRYSNTEIFGAGANDVTGTEKSTSDSRLKNAVIYTPITLKNWSAPDDDPESYSNLYPPTVTIPDNDRYRDRKNYNINGDITINLNKWINFKSEMGLDNTRSIDNRFFGLTTYYVTGGDATIKNKPAVQLTNDELNKFRNANILNASKSFESHKLSLMIGEEAIIMKENMLTNWIDGLPEFFDSDKAWSFTTQGTPRSTENKYYADEKMLSYFGRFNYDYKGRYLLTATLRADGSSKFKKGNRWGIFPSFAAAWRISDENFMKSTSNWLSNLKLRFSYGSAGNNNIPSLAYMQTYSSYNTSYLPASLATSYWAASSTMPNDQLKWETTVTRNIGLDFGLFNERLSGTTEFYLNNTKNLLIDFPVSGSGYSTQIRNIGKTSNRGFELTLNGIIINKQDIKLELSFNISANKNRVDDLGGLTNIIANSAWTSDAQASNDFIVKEGQPVGTMYGYVTDGFYSADDFTWNGNSWILKDTSVAIPDNKAIAGVSWGPGALKLKDLNGDSTITEADKTIIGCAMPKNTGGFSINANIKNFDIALNFNWVYGNNIYNANKIEFTTVNKYKYRNMLDIVNSENRWTNIDPVTGDRINDADRLKEINSDATIWSPAISKYVFHSWAVEDGSFLRLNNVVLGYKLPTKLVNRLYIKQLRVYISAYNLFVLTRYSGYDPEVDTRRKTPLTPGVDYSAYPKSRSFNFGVNISL